MHLKNVCCSLYHKCPSGNSRLADNFHRRPINEAINRWLEWEKRNIVTNRQAVVESLDWTIDGFALWDGNLIRKIRLEEFGTYSDEFSARNLFYQCDIVTFSEGLYYHRINNQSITGKISIQTYDRPYALYRTASFLEEHGFDENYINGLHFAVFKDCCFLLYLLKNLTYPQSSDAELRIKKVHELVSKNRVRDSVFYKEYGRAALWRVEGKIGKYIIVLLTFLNWELLKKAPLQLLLDNRKKTKLLAYHYFTCNSCFLKRSVNSLSVSTFCFSSLAQNCLQLWQFADWESDL